MALLNLLHEDKQTFCKTEFRKETWNWYLRSSNPKLWKWKFCLLCFTVKAKPRMCLLQREVERYEEGGRKLDTIKEVAAFSVFKALYTGHCQFNRSVSMNYRNVLRGVSLMLRLSICLRYSILRMRWELFIKLSLTMVIPIVFFAHRIWLKLASDSQIRSLTSSLVL
jgi:hypothetical protein